MSVYWRPTEPKAAPTIVALSRGHVSVLASNWTNDHQYLAICIPTWQSCDSLSAWDQATIEDKPQASTYTQDIPASA
jgi:hypothetical protein